MSPSTAHRVAEKCFDKFRNLPKQGKPTEKQWTVLSGFVLVKIVGEEEQIKIVTLATGTKCLDGSTRLKSNPGTLIHDSHAEILARRGFILWLVDEMILAREGLSKFIFKVGEDKYDLVNGWKILMLTTHPPCGDATIFVKDSEVIDKDDVTNVTDNPMISEPPAKKTKLDLNRTGAKVLIGSELLTPGLEYHKLGEVRTKPGRGDRTLSLSCSDKIIKWNISGLQGALCSYFLSRSLYLHSFLLTGRMFNKPALERALYGRAGVSNVNKHILTKVEIDFEFSKTDARPSPCPDSVVWVDVQGGKFEALTEGHKQGWSKKKLSNPKSWSMLCQRNLVKRFLALAGDKFCGSFRTYTQLKSNFLNNPERLVEEGSILKNWPQKEISNFFLADL